MSFISNHVIHEANHVIQVAIHAIHIIIHVHSSLKVS
jgi:hypothetical protein